MKNRLSDHELLKFVHLVKAKLAALPAISAGDWASHDAFHRAAAGLVSELVTDHGGRLSRPLGGHRLSMAGVSATSTCGENGVVTNWISAAYRELDRRRAT